MHFSSLAQYIHLRLTYFPALPYPSLSYVHVGTIRKVGSVNFSSTFVSSTLVAIASDVVSVSFALYDRAMGHTAAAQAFKMKDTLHRMFILLGVWLCYLVGAILATVAYERIGLYSLLPAVGVLLVLTAADLYHIWRKVQASRLDTTADAGAGTAAVGAANGVDTNGTTTTATLSAASQISAPSNQVYDRFENTGIDGDRNGAVPGKESPPLDAQKRQNGGVFEDTV